MMRLSAMRSLRFLCAGTLMMCAGSAHGAPFCFDSAAGVIQCIYDDAVICRHDAKKQHANCTINPREVALPATGAAYCGIGNTRVPVCLYPDFTSCTKAQRPQGVCVKRVLDEVQRMNVPPPPYFARALQPDVKLPSRMTAPQ